MDRERIEIHALSTETHTQNMGPDNNSPAENEQNTVSGTLGQWTEKRKEMHALSTETHTQNMGQDNNSPAENVHDLASRTLG